MACCGIIYVKLVHTDVIGLLCCPVNYCTLVIYHLRVTYKKELGCNILSLSTVTLTTCSNCINTRDTVDIQNTPCVVPHMTSGQTIPMLNSHIFQCKYYSFSFSLVQHFCIAQDQSSNYPVITSILSYASYRNR